MPFKIRGEKRKTEFFPIVYVKKKKDLLESTQRDRHIGPISFFLRVDENLPAILSWNTPLGPN